MRRCLFCLFLRGSISTLSAQSPHRNLLIIADDLGVDRIKGYHSGGLLATTPTLDSLRITGITSPAESLTNCPLGQLLSSAQGQFQ